MSMNPYTGAWTKAEAAHLLRRTMFGPTNQQILDAVANGMNATVTSLLQIPAISDPIAWHADETITAQGSTWVNDVYPTNAVDAQSVENARLFSLGSWIMGRINNEQPNISEKMCLFWQNHFAATASLDSRATYDYHMLIRSQALGNFKQLVKDITINPNMLLFLNGATNNVFSPNENYARELLELFTIGKGPQIAPGDYTNYKEEDIAAAAKILTGYYVDGLRSDTLADVTAVYNGILHDATTKTLSSHFGSVSIPDNGANEYIDLIDVIFNQNECANFICRKLYRYFVNYDLTASVETDIIPVMAATMIANNYDVLPVLTELLSSEHFYDIAVRGAIIRNPLESLYGIFNATSSSPNFGLVPDSEIQITIYWFAEAMGQGYAAPPSVAGWPAYYQEPSFSKLWANSTTMKTRFDVSSFVTVFTGIPDISLTGALFKADALTFVDGLSLPADAVTVIDDIADVFCPKGLSAAQKTVLKFILTGGLPDFEWTLQYNDYQANIGNPTFEDPVRTKVEQVLNRVFQSPEYHVI